MVHAERPWHHKLRSPWPWHRWLGIGSAVLVLWSAATGIVLVHADEACLGNGTEPPNPGGAGRGEGDAQHRVEHQSRGPLDPNHLERLEQARGQHARERSTS